ncbi:MAG TPA: hypothetical protein VFQ41_20215 [Candidatus Angelobacter sp.]|nr:hypothetical protein [Candidatus Angelobacter sp.]
MKKRSMLPSVTMLPTVLPELDMNVGDWLFPFMKQLDLPERGRGMKTEAIASDFDERGF